MNTNQQTLTDLREKRARLVASIADAEAATAAAATAAATAIAESGEAPASYAPDASRRGHNLDAMRGAVATVDEQIRLHLCAVDLVIGKTVTPRRDAATRQLAEAKAERHRLLLAAAQATATGANEPPPTFGADYARLESDIGTVRAELEAVAAALAEVVAQ